MRLSSEIRCCNRTLLKAVPIAVVEQLRRTELLSLAINARERLVIGYKSELSPEQVVMEFSNPIDES